jgi:hypothetical protein
MRGIKTRRIRLWVKRRLLLASCAWGAVARFLLTVPVLFCTVPKAEVSIVVRHELSAITGAVHADVGPPEVVVRFAEAAITDKGRFCSHTRD